MVTTSCGQRPVSARAVRAHAPPAHLGPVTPGLPQALPSRPGPSSWAKVGAVQGSMGLGAFTLTRQLLSSSASTMMVPHFLPGTPLGRERKVLNGPRTGQGAAAVCSHPPSPQQARPPGGLPLPPPARLLGSVTHVRAFSRRPLRDPMTSPSATKACPRKSCARHGSGLSPTCSRPRALPRTAPAPGPCPVPVGPHSHPLPPWQRRGGPDLSLGLAVSPRATPAIAVCPHLPAAGTYLLWVPAPGSRERQSRFELYHGEVRLPPQQPTGQTCQ